MAQRKSSNQNFVRERERVMAKPEVCRILKKSIQELHKKKGKARRRPRSKKQDPIFYEKTKQSQLVRDS